MVRYPSPARAVHTHSQSPCPTVADLYIVLYDSIVRNGADNVDHGIRGYYFGENGEHSWYAISKEIARVLVEKGIGASDEPTSFTADELVQYWGSEVRLFRCFLLQASDLT